MLVLGIESTCDETACAIVRDGTAILANIVASQATLHECYGGVVPELACRRHVDMIIPVIDEALKQAGVTLNEIDLISVAKAPGLIGALMIGINAAKALSVTLEKPFIGVNHIEAHLYAAIMSQVEKVSFPSLGVVLSGGHTTLVYMRDIGDYKLISETIDDALGEAFDKVAKMMGLPYPGGPHIETLAKKGNPHSYPLKAGFVKGSPLSFSFSGLKTAVLYSLRGQNSSTLLPSQLSEEEKCNMAATFQRVALQDVVKKTLQAAIEADCETLIFGGGVTNNMALRELFAKAAPNKKLIWPKAELTLDNAAMIAGLGYHQFRRRGADNLLMEAQSRIEFYTSAKDSNN